MVKIMFVCRGNICRSPMAEFVMKDLVLKENLQDKVLIKSSATSNEALGCKVHRGTREILSSKGISCDGKISVKLKSSDYDEYDYIFTMDSNNMRNIKSIIKEDKYGKIIRLLDITDDKRDIADPWYTGDFNKTYDDILKGCTILLQKIKDNL